MVNRLTLVFLLAVAGCTTRLSNAPVTVPPADATLTPATAPADGYVLSAGNTHVTFVGSATLNSHEGTFTQLTGILRTPDADPDHATLTATIAMASVYTQIPLLTKHLKDADFFDVDTYPRATFTSTRIEPNPASTAGRIVTGQFAIHGTTRTVSFPATITITADGVRLDATITIRQSDFGMDPKRSTADDVPVTVTCRLGPADRGPR